MNLLSTKFNKLFIKNIRLSIASLPIRGKLYLFFTALVVLPLLLLVIITFSFIQRSMISSFETNARQSVESTTKQIEMSLREADNTILTYLWNPAIQAILRSDYSNETLAQSRVNAQSIENQLQTAANTRLDIGLLYLLRSDDKEYYYIANVDCEDVAKRVWYSRNELEKQSDRKKGRILWRSYTNNGGHVLGYRTIYDIDNLKKIGFLAVEINEESIKSMYKNSKIIKDSFFVVYDAQGIIVSTNAPPTVDLSQFYEAAEQKKQVDWHTGDKYWVSNKKIDYCDWQICMVTPVAQALADITNLRLIIISSLFFILALLLVSIRLFSNYFTEPVNKLIPLMHRVEQEDFTVYASETREDEYGELMRVFNKMIQKIHYLIEEVYKGKLIMRETEYKYLRAQINPHFLYNTLDSINWLAQLGGMKDVGKMSVALGRLMRRSISSTEDVVPLRDELNALEDYMTIQRMRYGEKLVDTVEVPADCLDCLIPQMTLQPLVENALVHGIEKRAGVGHIRIYTRSTEELFELCVEDDGIGASGERIRNVMDTNASDTIGSHSGVGINNVNKRLQMLFGEKYGLRIESEVGIGTTVFMRLPFTSSKKNGGEL